VRVGICAGDGGYVNWGCLQDGFASWGDLVRVLKFGVQDGLFNLGCCELLVSKKDGKEW
jgi:hypothetical protein